MKRLSTSATILVSALLINTPAFSADKQATAAKEDVAVVTVTGAALGSESDTAVENISEITAENTSVSAAASDTDTEKAAETTHDVETKSEQTLQLLSDSKLESEKSEEPASNTDESMVDASNIDKASETIASEALDISEEAENTDIENASDTENIKNNKKEAAKPDDSWSEKVSGKKLNTLKAKLDELQGLYDVNWRSYCIAEAINNVERSDSPKKRNASLLDDLTRQQLFTAYAVTYVFPELLEIHLQNVAERLKNKADSLVDEIVETEEETKKIIDSYLTDVNHYRTVNGAYISLVDKAQAVLDSIIKTNTDTANLTGFGYYLKNTNGELLKLVASQMDSLREVTEQSSFTVDYCRQQAEFVVNSKESISTKSKYFAEIRSSFKDLEIFLEKYKSKQEFNFHLLSKAINRRYEELVEKVGKDEIRVARVRKLVNETRFKPVNKSIKILNTQSDLEDIFEKFGFKEVDAKLFETLLAYVGEENWHCRYKEPVSEEEDTKQKSKKTKAGSGEKPKLIDLEEDENMPGDDAAIDEASQDGEVATVDENAQEGDAVATDGAALDGEAVTADETVIATDSAKVGTDAQLANSPDQVDEQKQVEEAGGVGADSRGISSDTENINKDHIE